MEKLTRYIMLCVLAVILAVLWNYGVLQVAFYASVFWLACPHYNVLSPSCGNVTLDFVIERVFLALLVVAAFIGVWTAWRGRK